MSATIAQPGPAKDTSIAATLGRRRSRRNGTVEVLCIIATVIGVLLLASILGTLLYLGFSGLSLNQPGSGYTIEALTNGLPGGDDRGMPGLGFLNETCPAGRGVGRPCQFGLQVGHFPLQGG